MKKLNRYDLVALALALASLITYMQLVNKQRKTAISLYLPSCNYGHRSIMKPINANENIYTLWYRPTRP